MSPTRWPERARRAVVLVLIAATLAFLTWRVGWTLNPAWPIASALLLVADLITGVSTIGFAASIFDLSPPTRTPVNGTPPPTVDVWIPTVNESPELLRRTITMATRIRYPHTTWVLDDGNREEVRAIAEELGARWLARPSHEHAKAGTSTTPSPTPRAS